jgi:thioredoxin-dependent peroxiredoxin
MSVLKAGQKAPAFAVKDQDGNLVTLSDFSGRKVVLYFYPKDMTEGCTAQACNLRDNYKVLQKQGYEVLGVSTDDEQMHKKFIAKEKLPFRLLADTNKALHEAYGTWGEKSMYGRKFMGTLRTTFLIDENGFIEDIIEKVKTKDHTAQILKNNPVQSESKSGTKNILEKSIPKKAAKKSPKKSK